MKKFSTTSIFLIALVFTLSYTAQAQDPYFSQFYAAPLQTNPALTGVFEGKFRIGANYREQWSSILGSTPFRTISASFDMRQQVMKGDYIGFGVTAMKDEADARFEQNRGGVSVSFLKQLGGSRYRKREQYLIAGGYAGVGQNSLEAADLWFSQQFRDTEGFIDYGTPNGEAIDLAGLSSPMYLDFSAGLLWYGLFDDNRSLYVGGSVHHLTAPNIAFLEDASQSLYQKFIVQAGGELPLNGNNLSLLPAVIATKQGSATAISAGGNFRYTNREWKEVALRIGGWGHIANKLDSGVSFDAFIVTAVLETEKLQLGASYDFTTNKLVTATNARGAFEVSLIYIQPEKNRRLRVNCPKF